MGWLVLLCPNIKGKESSAQDIVRKVNIYKFFFKLVSQALEICVFVNSPCRYLLIVYCSCDKVDMMEDNGEKDREQSLNVQR